MASSSPAGGGPSAVELREQAETSSAIIDAATQRKRVGIDMGKVEARNVDHPSMTDPVRWVAEFVSGRQVLKTYFNRKIGRKRQKKVLNRNDSEG